MFRLITGVKTGGAGGKKMRKMKQMMLLVLLTAGTLHAATARADQAGDMSKMDMKQMAAKASPPPPATATIGGAFSLTDQDGHAVTDKTYAGDYTLVYFGYASCPDVCPTTLHTLARVLEKLGPDAKRVHVLFVTTDPARDTPAALKKYTALFGSARIIGLTGTAAQIRDVEAKYKVYAQKNQDPALNGYTVDHSSVVYFMAPGGASLGFFGIDDTADAMTAKIKAALGGGAAP
jgi:protein SCO1/2